MNKSNYCVIMAGGLGTRFWPISKTALPKQFIDVLGTGKTLIQQTYERFEKILPSENIFIVTNTIYKELVKEQIPHISDNNILCEPLRRNTAPCIAYAVSKIACFDEKANIVVAPSDHIILDETEFINIVNSALDVSSKNDWLITLGIKPSRPDTGYGYIQFNDDKKFDEDKRLRKVKTFTEKPNLTIAQTFIKSGDFLWNAGIFIWSAKSIMNAFKQHLPEIFELFVDGKNFYNTSEEESFINKTYSICRGISIDYGVMEKADNVYVFISDFGWSDLGTWVSLYENRQKDNNGNAIVGQNVMMYNSTDCVVHIPKNKLAVIQGLHNYVVAMDDNSLLICRKEDEQEIKNYVNDVIAQKGERFV